MISDENGVPAEAISVGSRCEIPGYFRPTKDWDWMTLRELISVTLAWLDASLPNWFWMPVDTPETNERRYIPEPVEPKHVVIYQATGDEIISFGDHVDEMAFKHKQRIRAWFIAHGLWANRPDTRPRIWVEPYRDVRRPSGNTDTDRVQ